MGGRKTSVCMRVFGRALSLMMVSLVALAPTVGWNEASAATTALDDYVAAPDEAYAFASAEILVDGEGFTIHLVELTSQRWRTEAEVWRAQSSGERTSLWRHWVSIIVPDKITTDTALVIVSGGSNDGSPPSGDDEEIGYGAGLAVLSGSVVAVLEQVPNQPLFFADEPFAHREDEIVAYSWDKAMTTGDYTWAVYLPMVKSVVRAMDAVQESVPSVAPGVAINQFVIAGFSKRGASTWLTAAVDPRIKAIAPGVIDILNFAPQIEHHLAVYGEYSPAIQDYVDYDIVSRGRTPEGQALLQVVDPLSYRDRLVMPKLIVNATGDQFFPPDSSRFYFSKLLGETLLRYVANTDHSLSTSDDAIVAAVNAMFSWYLHVLYGIPRPTMYWRNEAMTLTVSTSEPALTALLWQATNANARDFRSDTVGEAWSATSLGGPDDREFVAHVETPLQGWRAYFVEIIYPPKDHGLCQSYSTQVYVTPDERPFEELDPVRDPEDIAYPVNPPPQSALDPGATGVFPDDLPLAEINDAVASVADPDVLKYLPDDVSTWLAEECPNLALARLGERELERRGEEALDDLVDEVSNVGESVVEEVADWF